MIHLLVGSSREEIAADYCLTRIGVEVNRKQLTAQFEESFGRTAAPTPGLKELAAASPLNIYGFIDALEETYGGVEGYLTKELGFSGEELDQTRANLRE